MKDMKDYNAFELAGYTEEESEKLIEICHERGMDYNQMLSFLRPFDTRSDEVLKELSEYGKSPLEIAWSRLIGSIAESLRIYKILDWLNEKLSKLTRKEN